MHPELTHLTVCLLKADQPVRKTHGSTRWALSILTMVKKMELPALDITTKESEENIANSILYWRSSPYLSASLRNSPFKKCIWTKEGGGGGCVQQRDPCTQIQSPYFETPDLTWSFTCHYKTLEMLPLQICQTYELFLVKSVFFHIYYCNSAGRLGVANPPLSPSSLRASLCLSTS